MLPDIVLPKAEISKPGNVQSIGINGLNVSVELQFRLSRPTKTNKIKTGGVAFRYSKGKRLAEPVAEWQSAFILGYLRDMNKAEKIEPTHALCITLDIFSGTAYPAPTNAICRYSQMKAACATIAEMWPNIPPPANAVL